VACAASMSTTRVVSTVLAQDHFYRDFLSLHMSKKTQKLAVMMLAVIAPLRICALVLATGWMSVWCSDVLSGKGEQKGCSRLLLPGASPETPQRYPNQLGWLRAVRDS